jgi:hypothetical protein
VAHPFPVPPEKPNTARRQPSLREFDFASTIAKKPRYGLVVIVVGAVSLAMPVILFLWLHQGGSEPATRAPTELVPDPVGRGDPPRPRTKPGGSASAAPAGTHSQPATTGGGARGGANPWANKRR